MTRFAQYLLKRLVGEKDSPIINQAYNNELAHAKKFGKWLDEVDSTNDPTTHPKCENCGKHHPL